MSLANWSGTATFRLHQFLSFFCFTSFVTTDQLIYSPCYHSILPEVIKKTLKWVYVTMRSLQWSTYTAQLWFLDPLLSPLYTHVRFSTAPFPQVRCVHKTFIPATPKHYHHLTLTYNFSIKVYQTLNQLKNNRKQLKEYCSMFSIQCLQKNVRRFFQLVRT